MFTHVFLTPVNLICFFFQPVSLQSLQEELSETDIHVIFWNKQFHTAIKVSYFVRLLSQILRNNLPDILCPLSFFRAMQ